MKKVVIQGVPGAFHEIAARSYFAPGKINIIPCRTFSGLFEMVGSDPSLIGIVAVENSLAGSILPNLTLLRDSKVTITGECKLRIGMNLLALPGQSIDDIREVYSHPVALKQCTDFFKLHPKFKITPSDDTAMSALEISNRRQKGAGVVASALAAKLYGLNILASGIETNKRNFTRFLIVESAMAAQTKKQPIMKGQGKATLVFTLPHEQGSLVATLTMLAGKDCNLMMIQSNPVIGREWEYLFFIDLVFSDFSKYEMAIEEMKMTCNDLQVLGVYREGEVYSEENASGGEINDKNKIIELWNR